jgi:hypothetical protein
VSDGAIEEVLSIPLLVKFGLEVCTDKEMAQGLWESVKNINLESIKGVAVDFYNNKVDAYTSDKKYIVGHTVGKDAVQVATMISGGAAIFTKGSKESLEKGIKETGETIASQVRKAFTKSIDDAIDKLKSKAKYALDGTGKYADVLGHHPLAKIAFEGAEGYDLNKAFSVSRETLGGQAIHDAISGNQNRLYSAWKRTNPNAKLTIDNMVEIEIKAMTNAGIPEDLATGWAIKALEDLKIQGVTEIKKIPWNGIN